MDVGEEAPEVPAPSEEENENPVKIEPMEQEPSETPPEEPSTVEPSASTAEDAAKEIKDEPMDEITPKEESLEATPEVQDESDNIPPANDGGDKDGELVDDLCFSPEHEEKFGNEPNPPDILGNSNFINLICSDHHLLNF